jgi:hypothetical protein
MTLNNKANDELRTKDRHKELTAVAQNVEFTWKEGFCSPKSLEYLTCCTNFKIVAKLFLYSNIRIFPECTVKRPQVLVLHLVVIICYYMKF